MGFVDKEKRLLTLKFFVDKEKRLLTLNFCCWHWLAALNAIYNLECELYSWSWIFILECELYPEVELCPWRWLLILECDLYPWRWIIPLHLTYDLYSWIYYILLTLNLCPWMWFMLLTLNWTLEVETDWFVEGYFRSWMWCHSLILLKILPLMLNVILDVENNCWIVMQGYFLEFCTIWPTIFGSFSVFSNSSILRNSLIAP